ncbi:hypothetical protein ENUP19_0316G0009 [Entamoeba nuttalli]
MELSYILTIIEAGVCVVVFLILMLFMIRKCFRVSHQKKKKPSKTSFNPYVYKTTTKFTTYPPIPPPIIIPAKPKLYNPLESMVNIEIVLPKSKSPALQPVVPKQKPQPTVDLNHSQKQKPQPTVDVNHSPKQLLSVDKMNLPELPQSNVKIENVNDVLRRSLAAQGIANITPLLTPIDNSPRLNPPSNALVGIGTSPLLTPRVMVQNSNAIKNPPQSAMIGRKVQVVMNKQNESLRNKNKESKSPSSSLSDSIEEEKEH